MPISKLQHEVLRTIAGNRSPENYLAGATVLHRSDSSPRFSQDLDLFHDLGEAVAQSAEADERTLRGAGYEFEWILRAPTFCRALISKGGDRVRLEWAQDSAFRFFPVQEDALCGYRLHEIDAAVNKMLALAGRQEVRDFVDILHLNDTLISIGAMVWSGCGKDPGFTPDFLLDHVARHVAYTQADLDRLNLREQLDLRQLKRKWMSALEQAQQLINALPAEDVGCLYLDSERKPVTPEPGSVAFDKLTRHYGCVSGAWPRDVGEESSRGPVSSF